MEILHPEGTDPLTLTHEAIRIRDERKEFAEKGFAIPYDEVWVVFDLEKPHGNRRKRAVQAKNLKEAKGIKFALSDPCFEFWLLLHEEYTTASFEDCHKVIKQLEAHWKNYSKGQSPTPEFLGKIPIAVVHAERCRKRHETSGGDGNPSRRWIFWCETLTRQRAATFNSGWANAPEKAKVKGMIVSGAFVCSV